MANKRKEYIQQRVPQIVNQIMEAIKNQVTGLKEKSRFIKDRLSSLSGPQYDNVFFRNFIKDVTDSDNYVSKNEEQDDGDSANKKKYYIDGIKFKNDIEAYAEYLAKLEYDKRSQSNADRDYDGLKDFLSMWNKICKGVEQTVSAGEKNFNKMKREVDDYVKEHVAQLKGELLLRLAPGGKLILTAGWADKLDRKKVAEYLIDVEKAIDEYAKKARRVNYKGNAFKNLRDAISKALFDESSPKIESADFESLFDSFVKDVAEVECKLGMQMASGIQPNFLQTFDINFREAEATCDSMGWNNGKISKDEYVEWKAGAYRYNLLKAISGSDIYAKKGLPHRLKELRKLKKGVYAHESWGKLLDVFERAQYKDFGYLKGGAVIQQAIVDDELSAALDEFARHAAGTEYDQRSSNPSKSKNRVLNICIKVAREADQEFSTHENDIYSGKIFSENEKDATDYIKERLPDIKDIFQKRFGKIFNKDIIGSEFVLTDTDMNKYAMFGDKLSELSEKLLPVSSSIDAKWKKVCENLQKACKTLASGKKLTAIDADFASKNFNLMMNMLAGYEFWQQELSMGMTVPDSGALFTEVFGEDDKEYTGKYKELNILRDENYDWSQEKEEEEAFIAQKAGNDEIGKTKKRFEIIDALRGLFSFTDVVFDGSISNVGFVYHLQRNLSNLLGKYAKFSIKQYEGDDEESNKKYDCLSAIIKISEALDLKLDPRWEDNQPEEECKRKFEEGLNELADALLKLDESILSNDSLENIVDRLDELDESMVDVHENPEEKSQLQLNPLGAEPFFAGLSRITQAIHENMEDFRSIELAVNIIINTADNLDDAVSDMRQMLHITNYDNIHYDEFLEGSPKNQEQISKKLNEMIMDFVKYGYLEVEFDRRMDDYRTFFTEVAENICRLADYYIHRRSEPNREKPQPVKGTAELEPKDKWKNRRKNLAEEYVASRENEALASLETTFAEIEEKWDEKAYSEDITASTGNDEMFNKMEIAYGQFRSIATALKKKRSSSQPFTKEEMVRFKEKRNALMRSAEDYLSQMGDGKDERNTLLSDRRQLASHIKMKLLPFTTKATESSLLMPMQQAPQVQQQPENPGIEENISNEFALMDYNAFFQNNSKRVGQYMNFFMQRYGITSNEIALILGKGAKKGKEKEQAYTVLYDIIARNQIPSGLIPEERIINFVNNTCKKIRQKMNKASMTMENRLMLVEGLAGLFSTSEFDLERNYEQNPLSDKEKSGYHAKMTLYNYFYYLDEDHYNPDAWYKSGKISDFVEEWTRNREEFVDEEVRIEALRKKIDQKWKFGKELSELFAIQMDKAFMEIEDKKDLDFGENYEKDMVDNVKKEYISSLYMFRYIVNKIPSQKFADFNIELPPEIHDNAFASPLSSFTLKVDCRPIATNESLEILEDMIENGNVENSEAFLGTLNNVKQLLLNVEAFDLNMSMLSTRKIFRVFNWNSSEYNHCKSSLERLKGKRDILLRELATLRPGRENLQLDPNFLTGITTMITELGEEQRICCEAVETYNNKVYIENVRDKKQSAGMARFAGAQGMAALLKSNNGTMLSQKDTFRAQNEEGKAQLQKFQSAFKLEQEKRKAFGMDAVQRGAANKAKTELQM